MFVYIKKTEDYSQSAVYQSVKYLLEQMDVKQAVQGGKKVLLKPNMLTKENPDKAVTTHPQILRCVIDVLKEYGVKGEDMLIADSSGGPSSAAVVKANYKGCGFAKVSEETGVPLYINFEEATVKTEGVLVKSFDLLKPVTEYDIIINLAKFKTHVMTGMSGAVKNIFGTVPGLKKAEFHMRFPQKEKFAKMMVDLCQAVKPSFNIVDGVVAMEGDGPAGGNPKVMQIMLGGQNPYYIDHVICDIMGFDVTTPPIMKEAIDRNLCPQILPQGTVVGDTFLYKKAEDFALPKSYGINFAQNVPRAIRWATPAVEKLVAPKPKINKAACIGCGKCRDICPQSTITIENGKAKIEMKNCIKCFCCHEMCPAKAIDVKRFMLFNI